MRTANGSDTVPCVHGAKLLPFIRFLAHGLVSRQNFIPIFIALFHSIYFQLVLRAIWVAGFLTKMLG
jgi:hypothetical protein